MRYVTQNELMRGFTFRPAGVTAVVLGLLASLIGGASPAQAEPAPVRILSGWMPYWMTSPSNPEGVNSAVQNADLFVDVSPFWYSATSAPGGNVQVGVNRNFTSAATSIPWAMGQLKGAGLTVIPAIADGSGKGRMAAVLADPAKRAAHIGDLVAMVTGGGYDGLDLDYETFAFSDGRSSWAATQPNWTAFIQELSAALHAQGKLLSVTIPPPCDTRSRCGGENGYWVYNMPGIAPFADRIRIMAYDYSYHAIGPIAPITWVQNIVEYSKTVMDPAKLQIGVPTYGRAWTKKSGNSFQLTGNCPTSGSSGAAKTAWNSLTKMSSVTAAEIPNVLAKNSVAESSVIWDDAAKETWFEYDKNVNWSGGTCTARRVSWYVGPDGVLARSQLVGNLGINAAALWTIGGENPAQWALLRSYAQSLAPAQTTATLTVPGAVVAGQPITATGTVLVNGAPVAGLPAVLQYAPLGSADFVDLAQVATGADGTAVFTVTVPGSGLLRMSVPATDAAPAAVSAESTVSFGSTVSVKVKTPKVSPKGTIKVKAIVRPAQAGQKVLLQNLVNGSWKNVGAGKADARGRVVLTGKAPSSKGRYTYRVVARAMGAVEQGFSPDFRIRVLKR